MLVLTRRIGEALRIGRSGEIEVVVLGMSGNQVRLGINAPADIKIDREELYHKKSQERAARAKEENNPAGQKMIDIKDTTANKDPTGLNNKAEFPNKVMSKEIA